MSDLTRVLQSAVDGNPRAAEELLPLVYSELRQLAAAKMAREHPVTRSSLPLSCMKPGCDWLGQTRNNGTVAGISSRRRRKP